MKPETNTTATKPTQAPNKKEEFKANPQQTDPAVGQSAGMDWEEDTDFELEASSNEDEQARIADAEFDEDLSTDLPDEEEAPARPRVDKH